MFFSLSSLAPSPALLRERFNALDSGSPAGMFAVENSNLPPC